MGERELIERCKRIYDFFDTIFEKTEDTTLTGFIFETEKAKAIIASWSNKVFKIVSEIDPKAAREFDEGFCDFFQNDVPEMAFAVGYVIGQTLDSTDPKVSEDIQAVKEMLRDSCLLPYLPRERKTA